MKESGKAYFSQIMSGRDYMSQQILESFLNGTATEAYKYLGAHPCDGGIVSVFGHHKPVTYRLPVILTAGTITQIP